MFGGVCRGIPVRVLAIATLAVLLGAGCAPPADQDSADQDSAGREQLRIVASFYPLQYVVDRIAGSDAVVTDLTSPGTEPHDLELGPRDVADLTDADLIVYLSGFQPAVDDAVSQQDGHRGFDVAPYARLVPPEEHGADHAHQYDGAVTDPHFWLDPDRLASVARHVRHRLVTLDHQHRAAYRHRTRKLIRDLRALDTSYRSGLRSCRDRRLVTSHTAFGYLAARYGFEQVGVAGLSPEAEPKAQRMARIVDFIRAHHVTTVYTETLASPAIARTLSEETGTELADLDPVEGITDHSAGDNYLAVMRANLRTLVAHQDCR